MKRKTLIILTSLVIEFVSIALVLNLPTNQPKPSTTFQYELQIAFPHLNFSYPVGIYHSGDGTNRLFVVGQMGFIYVFENHKSATEIKTFLDIHDRVHLGAFLGLAFHPDFAKNGHFYVNCLADDPLRTIISEWAVSPSNSDEADMKSERILLEVPQLHDTHSGGQLAFGPDGYLYIALGDGGPQRDPDGNAQNCSKLLGKILRINVDATTENTNYSVPEDNPFVGNSMGYREEIYAYGFRNPWRFSFDPVTSLLWAGDVGEDRMEEIDIIKKGKNYGWNIMEGTLCFNPEQDCNQTGLELPIWEYGRDQGNATIGGFVYRGLKLTELSGCYIYGDYVSGRIWALNTSSTGTPLNKELVKANFRITSFGVDEKNEVYICADDGKIYQIVHLH